MRPVNKQTNPRRSSFQGARGDKERQDVKELDPGKDQEGQDPTGLLGQRAKQRQHDEEQLHDRKSATYGQDDVVPSVSV